MRISWYVYGDCLLDRKQETGRPTATSFVWSSTANRPKLTNSIEKKMCLMQRDVRVACLSTRSRPTTNFTNEL